MFGRLFKVATATLAMVTLFPKSGAHAQTPSSGAGTSSTLPEGWPAEIASLKMQISALQQSNGALQNQFTRGAFGGLVAGQINTISRWGASTPGGYQNTASGGAASVTGGSNNTAGGFGASVTGGQGNSAMGPTAAVSGG